MKIEFHKNFKKKYKKLGSKEKNLTNDKLRLFEVDPFNSILNNHPLSGDREGQRSIDIKRDLLAIYEAHLDSALFIDIDNHNNLYK